MSSSLLLHTRVQNSSFEFFGGCELYSACRDLSSGTGGCRGVHRRHEGSGVLPSPFARCPSHLSPSPRPLLGSSQPHEQLSRRAGIGEGDREAWKPRWSADPGAPLTRTSPPACHRASRSELRAPAPQRRLQPRSAAACGWHPPSGRPGRGLSWHPRRQGSGSSGCWWRRARLRG